MIYIISNGSGLNEYYIFLVIGYSVLTGPKEMYSSSEMEEPIGVNQTGIHTKARHINNH